MIDACLNQTVDVGVMSEAAACVGCILVGFY